MLSIKELTQDLHTELEDLPFNQKMFRGEQTPFERKSYIVSQLKIFKVLDTYVPERLRRVRALEGSIERLRGYPAVPMCSALRYAHYMRGAYTNDIPNVNAHIYLNYMGFLYGGQIMKKRYPTSAAMYQFDDPVMWREYIRANHIEMTDDFVSEVRTGFEMQINISRELNTYT